MKRKYNIILTILLAIILINTIIPYNYVCATNINMDDIIDTGKDWENTGRENANTTIDSGILKDAISQIFGVLFSIAVIITIVIGAIIGIQIMVSPVDGKADAKKALIPYVISCVVIYGAIGIWATITTILRGF